MSTDWNEPEIKELFRELRRAEEADTPPLEQVLQFGRTSTRVSPAGAVLAGAAALFSILLLVNISQPDPPTTPLEWPGWDSPTAFLLTLTQMPSARDLPSAGILELNPLPVPPTQNQNSMPPTNWRQP